MIKIICAQTFLLLQNRCEGSYFLINEGLPYVHTAALYIRFALALWQDFDWLRAVVPRLSIPPLFKPRLSIPPLFKPRLSERHTSSEKKN